MLTDDSASPSREIRVLLHVGTGSEKLIGAYEDNTEILCVEANPGIVSSVSRDRRAANLEIFHAVFARQDGQTSFRLFNVPELGSSRNPTGVLQHFPGLRELSTIKVEGISLDRILRLRSKAGKEANHLILDLGGDEFDFLKDLSVIGKLKQFQVIEIYCGEKSWYAGAPGPLETQSLLTSALYRLVSTEHDQWGRLHLTFRPDDLRRVLNNQANRLDDLEALLEQRNEAIEAQNQELILAEKELSRLKTEIDSLAQKLDEAHRQAVDEGNTRKLIDRKLSKQDERISRQVAEVDRLTLRLEERERQINEERALRKAYELNLQRLQAQLELLQNLNGLTDWEKR